MKTNLIIAMSLLLPVTMPSVANAGFAAAVGYSNADATGDCRVTWSGSSTPKGGNDHHNSVVLGGNLLKDLRERGYKVADVFHTSERSAYFTVGVGEYNNRKGFCPTVGTGTTQAEADRDFNAQLKFQDATKNIQVKARLYSYGSSPGTAAPATDSTSPTSLRANSQQETQRKAEAESKHKAETERIEQTRREQITDALNREAERNQQSIDALKSATNLILDILRSKAEDAQAAREKAERKEELALKQAQEATDNEIAVMDAEANAATARAEAEVAQSEYKVAQLAEERTKLTRLALEKQATMDAIISAPNGGSSVTANDLVLNASTKESSDKEVRYEKALSEGLKHLAAKKYAEATRSLTTAINLFPQRAEAAFRLATALSLSNDAKKAHALLESFTVNADINIAAEAQRRMDLSRGMISRSTTFTKLQGWEGVESVENIRQLLREIDPNATSVEDVPLLSTAIVRANPDVVKILVEAGANPNKRDKSTPIINEIGVSPLDLAISMNGPASIVEILLNAGANPNALSEITNKIPVTVLAKAFQFASLEGNPWSVDAEKKKKLLLLVSKSSNVNVRYPSAAKSFSTPLLQAIETRDLDLVKALVEKGARINGTLRETNGEEFSYLDAAGHPDIIAYLKEKGAHYKRNSQPAKEKKTLYGAAPTIKTTGKSSGFSINTPSNGEKAISPLIIRGQGTRMAKIQVHVKMNGTQFSTLEYQEDLGVREVLVDTNGIWQSLPIDLPLQRRNVTNMHFVVTAMETGSTGVSSNPISITLHVKE